MGRVPRVACVKLTQVQRLSSDAFATHAWWAGPKNIQTDHNEGSDRPNEKVWTLTVFKHTPHVHLVSGVIKLQLTTA